MARIKKHRTTRSHQETKPRRRKLNIPELVYKYLVAEGAVRDVERTSATKCRCCGQEQCHKEVINSADSPRTTRKSTGYKLRRDDGRVTKSHSVKRHPVSKNLPVSYLQKCVGNGDLKKARKYIREALEFGVDSGYLIPSDSTYKILRVSSDLMRSDSQKNKMGTCRTFSQERDRSPHEGLDEYQQQGRRRRRRRRRGRARRSRSGSRRRSRRRGRRSVSRSRRGRRCSSPQNSEEVAEDEADDYDVDENDPKSNIHTDDTGREAKTTRSNVPEEDESLKKLEENISDLSMDEDDTDDEKEKNKSLNS